MRPLPISRRAEVIALIFVLSATFVSGQTRAEIEARVGRAVNVYSVSGRIWMSPEYAADGQVCRMRFYPKHFSGNTSYVGIKELPFDEFRNAIDVIVPVASRGAKMEPFENGWNGGGGVMWTIFRYERVTIEYSAGFRIDAEAIRKSEFVDLDFPVSTTKDAPASSTKDDKKTDADRKADLDDFSTFHESSAEIVTVVWNDRKCQP